MIETLYEQFIESSGVSTDTRSLQRGELFFCLSGESFNGNKFALQALEKGARIVVLDDEKYFTNQSRMILVEDSLKTMQELASFHRDKLDIPVIGITGTNGKTTTKELLAAVLSSHFNISYTKGNLNNHIGVPLSLLKVNAKHDMAIIEMGANHLGEIAELCDICKPNLGVITNIGHAHLEGFGSYQNIKTTKLALYRAVEKVKGCVFVNADDEVLMDSSTALRRNTYGIGSSSQTQVELSASNVSLVFEWNEFKIETHLFGNYNLYNAAAAIAIGEYFKIPQEKIVHALESYMPSNNRSQIEKGENNELIMDAYNANPDSMKGALQFFKNVDFPNKMVVLGDMLELGEFEEVEHLKVLNDLIEYSFDIALLVGDAFLQFEADYPEFNFFKTSEEAKQYLMIQGVKSYKILLKGSRGIKLEVLKEVLL
ncbi:UDP-N-acetylmuramoyl-tripeptide--D-alanyl-D-alanine ligase [Lentimicrobium sp. L6]|uniref:UDP-N-acetylmuramoyl-tripeptide--D-alanyl-D- alanine ligase n=1 Tax=Lentimicrobium sp. L6 TaxID=2735916 RepID=UPI001555C681|nr:UDP-N-acetylmuramoyl-tripeptide--D-alanyl-D-alanine ligase [Lentimicrobium sp. L6]NPD83570.1 UDP-N-acetylmuramoyl-tripeptide--D-alanyl-D-alanine ligase [Lentimicrobium sp. L6]